MRIGKTIYKWGYTFYFLYLFMNDIQVEEGPYFDNAPPLKQFAKELACFCKA